MNATSRPWYKRPLTLSVAIIGGLIFATAVFFIGQTIYFMVLIKTGKMKPLADTRFDQLRKGVSQALDNRLTEKEIKTMESGDHPALGNPDAKLHIVEFLDYSCQYCKQAESVVNEYMARHATDTYLIIRDFPVTELHPYAEAEALAADCVLGQDRPKYWLFKDRLFATQGGSRSLDSFLQEVKALGLDTNTFASCYRGAKPLDQIQASVVYGEGLGLKGTPMFFFNGTRFEGVLEKDVFEVIADEARKKAETK